MRFSRVAITGFGGVHDQAELDLDAHVVLLVGANGFGKSTVCDAIAWALTGLHPRGSDPRSLYSRSGETQVALTIRESSGSEWTVRRIVSNPAEERAARLVTSVVLSTEDGRIRGAGSRIVAGP
jgi:DNA repair exonuclease SbcCD ATPase subunit